MKVWEKCNEFKGTNATIDEIAGWAYGNRICPLIFDEGLDIEINLEDNGFVRAAQKICKENECGWDCLMKFLNEKYVEVEKMKIRVTGTLEECKEFKNLFLLNVNKENSYSVSDFYPNRGSTNQYRLYIDFSPSINSNVPEEFILPNKS